MRITDNSKMTFAELQCSEQQREDLHRMAEIRLSDATASHLLIYPQDFKHVKDGISEQTICSVEGESLITGNIMGFVGLNGTRLAITSRFENQADHKDYFLHYMLQKVLSLSVFDLKHGYNSDDGLDFLIYLFPKLLLTAYRQGIYKHYVRRHNNDANVKGAVNAARHIRQNPVFNGKIAYNTREYYHDNHVTQLVRHTIEYIKSKAFSGKILKQNKDISEAVAAFVSVTASYNRLHRHRIISENQRPMRHPYFTAYTPLQELCLAILRHDELKYGRKKDEVYGILFDGAWLWEEYLDSILSKVGFEHPRNKEGRGGKYLFTNNSCPCYPDFYNKRTVVDAKYKRVADERISREDLYQIITYLHVMEAEETGIIHPSQQSECRKTVTGTLRGKGGTVFSTSYPVPQNVKDMKDFVSQITRSEKELAHSLATE